MVVQCCVCKRVRDRGQYRHAWPGELPLHVSHTYCPRCARETLAKLQRGELPPHYAARHAGAAL
jgi:DNA primase large subunit